MLMPKIPRQVCLVDNATPEQTREPPRQIGDRDTYGRHPP